MENNIQSKKENEKAFTAGEVGVLLEKIDHKVTIIAEGHQMLNNKIDRIEQKVDNINQKLDAKAGVKMVFDHEERITKLEKSPAGA